LDFGPDFQGGGHSIVWAWLWAENLCELPHGFSVVFGSKSGSFSQFGLGAQRCRAAIEAIEKRELFQASEKWKVHLGFFTAPSPALLSPAACSLLVSDKIDFLSPPSSSFVVSVCR